MSVRKIKQFVHGTNTDISNQATEAKLDGRRVFVNFSTAVTTDSIISKPSMKWIETSITDNVRPCGFELVT